MKLRRSLLLHILAVLVPTVLFGLGASTWLVLREQRIIELGARGRTLTLRVAVDGELRASIDAAHVLAGSAALRAGDRAAFHAEMRAAVASHPNWLVVNLVEADGRQTLSTAVPVGTPLPPVADAPTVRRAAAQRQAIVSDLVRSPITGDHRVALRVPVVRDAGPVRQVLTVAVRPAAWSALLAEQELPGGWVAVIVDRSGQVLARSADAQRWVGEETTAPVRALLATTEAAGWLETSNRAGRPVYVAWDRSPLTGWIVLLAMPQDAYLGSARRALALLALAAAVAAALAALLSKRLSDQIAAPVARLAHDARRVARGRGPGAAPPAEPAIDEVRELTASLHAAWEAVDEREQNRRRAAHEAMRLDRAKDEFIAMLGHELRNPLGAMASASYIVRRLAAPSAAARQALGVIERQVRHMAHIVDDLLDLNQITLGRATLRLAPVELRRRVLAQLDAFDAQGRLARHPTGVDGPPTWARADASRVDQIVGNLLDNALKYSPAGTPVRIAVRTDGEQAVIEVRDEGPGVPEDLKVRMFEPFVQGERDLARSQGGFGIGLAVVKRLAEAQGGSVEVGGAPGAGTVFTVRLPGSAPAPADADAPPATLAARPYRVIVVEDNDDVRDTLVGWLSSLGHEVIAASDGVEGAELAIRECPEIALIDLGLPGLDGYGVAREIRASDCGDHIRLVALTGYGDLPTQRSAEAGFDLHLTKPLTDAHLVQLFGATAS